MLERLNVPVDDGDARYVSPCPLIAVGWLWNLQKVEFDTHPPPPAIHGAQGVLRRVGGRLSHCQHVAYKCLAALGAHEWRPKMKGQRGVRILCFDGGGTRGVLTLALLKHVEKVGPGLRFGVVTKGLGWGVE